MMPNIEDYLISEAIEFEINIALKTKTWIKRGGTAKYWIEPTDIATCERLISWCQLNNIDHEIIGDTSNCYFLNEYDPFLVISTLKLQGMKIMYNDTIECECGCNMTKFAKYCTKNGYANYEGFIGLPGTVGGAVINNSGCYGSLISNVVKEVILISEGKKKKLANEDMQYVYRSSIIKSKQLTGFVSKVIFNIDKKDDPDVLLDKSKEYQYIRKTFSEHKHPNLGSTYCRVELKKLPLFLRVYNKIYNVIISVFTKDILKCHKLKVKQFLRIRNVGAFSKYISELGYFCFTWQDEGADLAFIEYTKFINKISNEAKLEIEIKGVKNNRSL